MENEEKKTCEEKLVFDYGILLATRRSVVRQEFLFKFFSALVDGFDLEFFGDAWFMLIIAMFTDIAMFREVGVACFGLSLVMISLMH